MWQRIRQQREDLDVQLHPNETIVYIMHRHVVYLLLRLLVPFGLLLISAGMAFYRGMGGQFFVSDAAASGQPTGFDIGLLVALGLLLASAVALRRRRGLSIALVGLGVAAVGWLLFRLRGGRILYIDPYAAQAFDGVNFVLIVVALALLVFCFYIYEDWRTDEFILTSHRVVYNNVLPLVRREQEQLPLTNIQQVEASTSTYLQHWLKLGTLQIKSAAVGFTIFFEAAYDPDQMQRKIMEQVKKARRAETDADMRKLVDAGVAGKPANLTQPDMSIEQTVAPGALQWLFPINPEFDRERDTYTWRPHWFFLVRAVWLPTALWLTTMTIVITMILGGMLGPILSLVLMVTVTVVFGAWAAWLVEDHRNDRYILTPTQIIDVSKKPFGPESRRTASLDAIQNVNYKTTLLGRIFGYGDVLLQTAGSGDDFTFFDAPRPSQMVDVITGYQVAHKRAAKIRSLEDTVKLIQYYDARRKSGQSAPVTPAAPAAPLAREVGGF